MSYDAFISHASEDKREVARPLADRLEKAGMRVWLDEFELAVGDSLRQKIDQGLSGSRFGIVVLSRSFFSKKWPQEELDALVAQKKKILPVWHNLTESDVSEHSPLLAGKIAVSTSLGMKKVAKELIAAIKKEQSKKENVFLENDFPPPPLPKEEKGLQHILPGRWKVRLEGRSDSNTGYRGVRKGMFGLGFDAFVQLDECGDFYANAENFGARQPWTTEGLWLLEDAHTLKINWCAYFEPGDKMYHQKFHLRADSNNSLSGTIDDVGVRWTRAR